MHIFTMTLGTRGDFELFLLLSQELKRRGHRVIFGTSPYYGPLVRAAGIDWTPIGTSTQEDLVAILQSQTEIADKVKRVYHLYKQWILPQVDAAIEYIQTLAEGSDYFINNMKMTLKRQTRVIPGAHVNYDPPVSLENLRQFDAHQPQGGEILNLVAMPKKLLDPQDQWGKHYHFTGFWRDERRPAWEPPAELVAFLKKGTPPVVITLGSMVMFNPRQLAQTIAEALRLSGQRGIIVEGWSSVAPAKQPPAPIGFVGGWSSPTPAPASVAADDAWVEMAQSEYMYRVNEIPYDWLFPQASCVIHHGGCGTLAAVMRAARPSILLPQIPAQEQFGRMLEREGLSAGMFDVTSLNAAELAAAIRQAVTNEHFHQTARAWQQDIAADGGIQEAGDLIEAHWKTLQARLIPGSPPA